MSVFTEAQIQTLALELNHYKSSNNEKGNSPVEKDGSGVIFGFRHGGQVLIGFIINDNESH